MDAFTGFLAVSAAATGAIIWSARRGSRQIAVAVVGVTLAASIAWWVGAMHTLGEWGVGNSAARMFLALIPVPGAAGTLWIRWRPHETPPRGAAVAVLIAACCWIPIVGLLGLAAVCNGQC